MPHLSLDPSTRTLHRGNFDHFYTSDCFVNLDSFDARPVPDPRINRAWCITNGGYIVAIVFAEYYAYCEQDALDSAADAGKLDFLQVSDSDLADYQTGTDSEGYPEYEGIIHLGNASEPFDQGALDLFEVPAYTFALDPLVMAEIARQSREQAAEVLQDAQGAPDCDYPVGYHLLGNAIDYLRSDAGALPIACAHCHRTGETMALHSRYVPALRGAPCCNVPAVPVA